MAECHISKVLEEPQDLPGSVVNGDPGAVPKDPSLRLEGADEAPAQPAVDDDHVLVLHQLVYVDGASVDINDRVAHCKHLQLAGSLVAFL